MPEKVGYTYKNGYILSSNCFTCLHFGMDNSITVEKLLKLSRFKESEEEDGSDSEDESGQGSHKNIDGADSSSCDGDLSDEDSGGGDDDEDEDEIEADLIFEIGSEIDKMSDRNEREEQIMDVDAFSTYNYPVSTDEETFTTKKNGDDEDESSCDEMLLDLISDEERLFL